MGTSSCSLPSASVCASASQKRVSGKNWRSRGGAPGSWGAPAGRLDSGRRLRSRRRCRRRGRRTGGQKEARRAEHQQGEQQAPPPARAVVERQADQRQGQGEPRRVRQDRRGNERRRCGRGCLLDCGRQRQLPGEEASQRRLPRRHGGVQRRLLVVGRRIVALQLREVVNLVARLLQLPFQQEVGAGEAWVLRAHGEDRLVDDADAHHAGHGRTSRADGDIQRRRGAGPIDLGVGGDLHRGRGRVDEREPAVADDLPACGDDVGVQLDRAQQAAVYRDAPPGPRRPARAGPTRPKVWSPFTMSR